MGGSAHISYTGAGPPILEASDCIAFYLATRLAVVDLAYSSHWKSPENEDEELK